ncbi:MAG: hypothetical protein WKF47_12185 [Geodermatophilaceae bacterium]
MIADRAVSVETDGDRVVVLTRSGQRAAGQRLLVATGRRPANRRPWTWTRPG